MGDPWELSEFLGRQHLELGGIIMGVDVRTDKYYGNQEELAIVKLNSPFQYKNVTCEYFIASPRYENTSLNSLTSGQDVTCALTRIPAEQVHSIDPFDLSWWRGGGVTATARIVPAIPNPRRAQ